MSMSKKGDHSISNESKFSEEISLMQQNRSSRISYKILTHTAIILGLLTITLMIALLGGFLIFTTILLDIVMIAWHVVLLGRISRVEKLMEKNDDKKLNETTISEISRQERMIVN